MPAPSASGLKLDIQGARVALKRALANRTPLTSDHRHPKLTLRVWNATFRFCTFSQESLCRVTGERLDFV